MKNKHLGTCNMAGWDCLYRWAEGAALSMAFRETSTHPQGVLAVIILTTSGSHHAKA